jgi:hypothetical protein
MRAITASEFSKLIMGVEAAVAIPKDAHTAFPFSAQLRIFSRLRPL